MHRTALAFALLLSACACADALVGGATVVRRTGAGAHIVMIVGSRGNVCTGTERCVNGQCQSGTPLTCDDGDPCTSNTCNPTSGCSYPSNGLCCTTSADCNDSSSCTTDTCVNQRCQFVPSHRL